jgi:hypothetical protein
MLNKKMKFVLMAIATLVIANGCSKCSKSPAENQPVQSEPAPATPPSEPAPATPPPDAAPPAGEQPPAAPTDGAH